MSSKPVHVVGGGLAGSEAAWQLVQAGIPVVLHEMRPVRGTEAHQTDRMAELVCSNSFRSDDAEYNAVGLLHEEMRRCNSLILHSGDAAKLPAGGALAVDRDIFAGNVTDALEAHPLVTIERGEVAGLPPEDWDSVILATGPLTSPDLAEAVRGLTGEDSLAFFDAIAPIVHKESIDFTRAWFQSRYDKIGPGGTGKDYINCPFEKDEYLAFIQALLDGEKTEFKDWEKDTPYFEGCLPIEVMASRGIDTLRFGPMKPVGLTDPNSNRRPYAVLQLRQDNALGTLYNLVGFQTKMKYAEQIRVFRMIPGLENAEFARLGGLHRNTFLNSPKLLDGELRLKAMPRLRFAGQVTGVEGYVESAAIGLLAGRFAAAERLGGAMTPPPPTTALGALLGHITGGADAETFQPMNVNFGLFPEPDQDSDPKKRIRGRERKKLYSARALADLDAWLGAARLAAE
ncbi:MAG: methylenetetrahydrofolate--tRNA-(uracil(54)-C(5))-methyltransferase (FADH(2)-oxidizing) TrmFO [Alphaproteobacteria bacterium]|nr:methylenetetrahydrofolate--tRNA-(uracil(54)-C(5))-methyltransferase (FADH(2)-oxidizing) TrmFO [Alphaproteobacteria bacterium]MBU0797091.1 methylenetetrahydrofolate--tRNA-(uracil(54)-C(5))-methyltransferase (FADH(2)-oxidizing) TrmFO [Alphaproteobacteria bacterium]MBU0887898.1 methylenetetrahydrofolate--tRNA-(uracil(54)-C(5))-methyltransferase (FADH(2)-oxidizing) TrmFO [Alphaproteobacteria bacterium]MBU1814879.1 methylenetetrahydrofolate--tRNA-(uracil(54)-C(5))-methyltransferase (FADH(2)-oxidiz